MKTSEIIKTGIMGGIIIIIIELIVGFAAPSVVYGFSFVAMLAGGAFVGFKIKGTKEEAAIAGGLAGLIYIIFGFIILYQSILRHAGSASGDVVGLIIGIILGAIGGLVGYLASHRNSAKPSGKKR